VDGIQESATGISNVIAWRDLLPVPMDYRMMKNMIDATTGHDVTVTVATATGFAAGSAFSTDATG